MERRYSLLVSGAFGASLLLHGVAYAALSPAPPLQRRTDPASEVMLEVAPVPVPPREAPVLPPPKVEREEPVVQRSRSAPRPIEPAPPESAPETPRPAADLGGVTLTNETATGEWSAATGNGQPLAKPERPVAPLRPVPTVALSAPRPKPVPRLVSPSDLSERPRPPALDGVLRRYYPEEARRLGISGTASVRAEVGADGRVRQARVLSQSFPGFGEACRRTLAGSRWSPPKDRQGNLVPTEIGYKCRFVVDR